MQCYTDELTKLLKGAQEQVAEIEILQTFLIETRINILKLLDQNVSI